MTSALQHNRRKSTYSINGLRKRLLNESLGAQLNDIKAFTMSKQNSSHPDADLHPEATGLAKKTVDVSQRRTTSECGPALMVYTQAHRDEQPLKLYSGWFCPVVQRAWLVLEEKKIPYQYIEGTWTSSYSTPPHPPTPHVTFLGFLFPLIWENLTDAIPVNHQ